MKETTLSGSIGVMPVGGEEGDAKAIVLADPDSGEIFKFVIDPGLQQQVARWLKMGNKALTLELKEKQARLQAQMQAEAASALATPQNEEEAKVIQKVMRG